MKKLIIAFTLITVAAQANDFSECYPGKKHLSAHKAYKLDKKGSLSINSAEKVKNVIASPDKIGATFMEGKYTSTVEMLYKEGRPTKWTRTQLDAKKKMLFSSTIYYEWTDGKCNISRRTEWNPDYKKHEVVADKPFCKETVTKFEQLLGPDYAKYIEASKGFADFVKEKSKVMSKNNEFLPYKVRGEKYEYKEFPMSTMVDLYTSCKDLLEPKRTMASKDGSVKKSNKKSKKLKK